jgi:hypothetical protein
MARKKRKRALSAFAEPNRMNGLYKTVPVILRLLFNHLTGLTLAELQQHIGASYGQTGATRDSVRYAVTKLSSIGDILVETDFTDNTACYRLSSTVWLGMQRNKPETIARIIDRVHFQCY